MITFSLSVIIIIGVALLSGAALGWWISHFMQSNQEAELETQLAGLRANYDTAVEENNRLRQQLRHEEQNRAKAVSLLDASNDFGYLMETRKALEDSNKRSETHLKKLQEQEQHIVRLTSILQTIQSEHDVVPLLEGVELPAASSDTTQSSLNS